MLREQHIEVVSAPGGRREHGDLRGSRPGRRAVFFDEFAVQFYDGEHSATEDRFLMLGMSSSARLLLVCHGEEAAGEIIRIISARRATARESAFYQGG